MLRGGKRLEYCWETWTVFSAHPWFKSKIDGRNNTKGHENKIKKIFSLNLWRTLF